MEKSLLKASENGFPLFGVRQRLVEKEYLYFLLFGTDFIECIDDEEMKCSLLITYPSYIIENKCPDGHPLDDCFNCGNRISSADYHRSRMSSIKNIDKLKECVRTLV